MKSDYVDNWDALPISVQEALAPIIAQFDAGADLLFDRRLNLSFEAAIKDLSVPGIAAVTQGLRDLRELLQMRVVVVDAAEGTLLFDGQWPLTAYDLPLYTPCLYLSQLAQRMDGDNVRVWRGSTAEEIVKILTVMARYVQPDIETARVLIAALHDMAWLYPDVAPLLTKGTKDVDHPNAAHLCALATRLLSRR